MIADGEYFCEKCRQVKCVCEDQPLSDKDFKKLKSQIICIWGVYNDLQKKYREQTGKDYEWFK